MSRRLFLSFCLSFASAASSFLCHVSPQSCVWLQLQDLLLVNGYPPPSLLSRPAEPCCARVRTAEGSLVTLFTTHSAAERLKGNKATTARGAITKKHIFILSHVFSGFTQASLRPATSVPLVTCRSTQSSSGAEHSGYFVHSLLIWHF